MRRLGPYGALASVTGLALYVTGLQKKVLSPVIDRLGELATGWQLLLLVMVVVAVGAIVVWRAWRRRTELRRAIEVVEASSAS